MQNIDNIQIVYSFRVRTILELKGFQPLGEIPNPKNNKYKCWIYEASPAFLEAFKEVTFKKEGQDE